MAEKSLYFNALPDTSSPTGYDRNYNADDISEWMSVVWENGVVKGGLQVLATSGMILNLQSGRAAIKGKAYINDSIKSFTIATAPTLATRYDYIVIRYNNNVGVRKIETVLKQGTSTIPTVDSLTRNEEVYELMLCYIAVGVGATSITQAMITDCRGNTTLCPYFTAIKGYDDYYDAIIQRYESVTTLTSAAQVVTSTLSSRLYNSNYSILDIYTNGIKEDESNYTLITSGATIQASFTTPRLASSKITFNLGNFIDGEGLSTAIANYSDWVNDVETLNDKNVNVYVCNGINDNVAISNIVRAFIEGGNDGNYDSLCLKVVGTFGSSAMAGGSGTSSNPYKFFEFAVAGVRNRRVIVDFTNCSEIVPTIADGTYNVIFNINNIVIIGANVSASNNAENTTIRMFNNGSGSVKCQDCRFWINGYKDSLIALCGTFNQCRGSVSNLINNSYCFLSSTNGILRINGGEYYSYIASQSNSSAIIGQSGINAVSILYGVNAPTLSRSGFYQTNSILQFNSGGFVNCTDLVSALPLIVATGESNIRGTIAYSKPNQM